MLIYLSYLLQSLDIGCFTSLKHAYRCLIENKMQLDFNHINKFDFLEAYPQAHTEIFRPDTIKNSFAATDLIPFNPERMLEQLNIQLKISTLSGS